MIKNDSVIFFELVNYDEKFIKNNLDLLPNICNSLKLAYEFTLLYKGEFKNLKFLYIPDILIESIRFKHLELHSVLSSYLDLTYLEDIDCIMFESGRGYYSYIYLVENYQLLPKYRYTVCFYISKSGVFYYREVFYNLSSRIIENMTYIKDNLYENCVFVYKVNFSRETLLCNGIQNVLIIKGEDSFENKLEDSFYFKIKRILKKLLK